MRTHPVPPVLLDSSGPGGSTAHATRKRLEQNQEDAQGYAEVAIYGMFLLASEKLRLAISQVLFIPSGIRDKALQWYFSLPGSRHFAISMLPTNRVNTILYGTHSWGVSTSLWVLHHGNNCLFRH